MICSRVTRGCGLLTPAPPGWGLESPGPRFWRQDLKGLWHEQPALPSQAAPAPPPSPLLAMTVAQGIDLALCAVPVTRSRPHLFGEEKGGSVAPNRGGIHRQGPGEGSGLPGTGQAWRGARREREEEGSRLYHWGRVFYSGWGSAWVEVREEGGGSLTLITSSSVGRRVSWPCPQGVPSLRGEEGLCHQSPRLEGIEP